MDIISHIRKRYTSYDFSNRKISERKLNLILEAGRWAPSSHNSQNWSFIVIRDKKRINQVLNACYYGDFHNNPNVLIVIVMEPIYVTRKMLLQGSLKKFADTHKFMNISLPAYAMTLEAQSLGIQSFIASLLSKDVNKLLKVPQGKEAVLVVGLGYEQKNAFKKEHTRKGMKDIVFKEKYGDEYDNR